MTQKFKEAVAYVSDGDEELKIDYTSKGTTVGVLLLDKDPKDVGDPYVRRLVESILNLNASVLQHSVNQKNTNLSMSQVRALNLLGSFCGYLVGSTSWESNEVKDYDKDTLIRRLEMIINELK